MATGSRTPTFRERENNKRRERRRRAIAAKIFNGLRQQGNYNLPKHCDNNEVLKALCREAGWEVEDDGTTYRTGCKPIERVDVCASAPASPTSSSYRALSERSSLIGWLNNLSTNTTGAPNCGLASRGHQSAPVTPPALDSPRAAASGVKTEWDNVPSGSVTPTFMASMPVPRGASPVPCGTLPMPRGTAAACGDGGCDTPVSDVGDSDYAALEFWSRYNTGRWVNGTRVGGTSSASSSGFGIGFSGSATPTTPHDYYSGTVTPNYNFSANFSSNGAAGLPPPPRFSHQHPAINPHYHQCELVPSAVVSYQQQQPQPGTQSSPCSSMSGIVANNSGVANHREVISSSHGNSGKAGSKVADRLELTLATPVSSQ